MLQGATSTVDNGGSKIRKMVDLGIYLWLGPVLVLSVGLGSAAAMSPMTGLVLLALAAGFPFLGFIFFRQRRLTMSRLVPALMFSAIMLPSIGFLRGMPDVRIELVLTLIAWALIMPQYLISGGALPASVEWRPNSVLRWFGVFAATIMLSMAYAALCLGYSLIGRDFLELAKIAQYFLIFSLASNVKIESKQFARIYQVLLGIFFASALVAVAQYFNLANINGWFSTVYAPTQIDGLLQQGRVTGTTGNPNEFGALMVLATSLALSGTLFFTGLSRFISLGCLFMYTVALALTLSRTAVIACIAAVALIVFVLYPAVAGTRRLWRLLAVIPVLALVVFAVVALAPDSFFSRIGQVSDIQSVVSLQARMTVWRDTLELWARSPVFGWGPGKATMTTIVDNEWLLLLRRYGLVGVIVFVAWFTHFFVGLSQIRKSVDTVEVRALTVATQATLVAYGIYMITAAVYHALQLMPVLLVVLGLAYTQRRAAKG